MLAASLLLAAALGPTPSTATGASESTPPTSARPFAPLRADVSVTEDGLWILAYDARGVLMGDLQMIVGSEDIVFDVTFWEGREPSGHVWVRTTGDASIDVRTDLEPRLAHLRTNTMLGFASDVTLGYVPTTSVTKRQCMVLLASTAVTCGVPLFFPPAAAAAVWGCMAAGFTSFCSCGPYLPFQVC